ncbi:MAG: hypothetical protein JSV17_00955 [Candidatus Aminicenantes bacterium]|nr:MAG: hypothetical protein JSV17_00955 [Candidatus Aminicenantes bacterium]
MKQIHLVCFLSVFLAVLIFSTSLKAHPIEDKNIMDFNIDFSGVEKFLELTALLEKDQEPTQEQWDDMFDTPGYKILILREFNKNFLIERIKLAFMPSNEEALKVKLKEEKGFWAKFLPHFVRAKNQRKLIEEQVARFKSVDFIRAAVDEAREFLPDVSLDENLPLSFVIFGPDSRGYAPVVVDVLYAYDQGDLFISFMAHEFHHYYRNQYFPFAQDQPFIWMIDQIQGEGIADQINIGKWFHDKNLYPKFAKRKKGYLEWYAKSPEIIRKMGHLFESAYDHPEKKMEYGQQLRAIVPLSGHPTGFYMANLIIEQLGKEPLVKDIGNPFAFFRLYKQAADKKGGKTPTFSDKAIGFIRSLEKRYIR